MLQVGTGFDSSKFVSLAIFTFGQVRSLKSASQFSASFWQGGVGSVRLVGWQGVRFWQVGAFVRSVSVSKKLALVGQVRFFPGRRVFWQVKFAAVEFIETLLPKIEFVVKCSQDSRGSGLWSRSLAQPENA
jgi:hypothetical protein